MKPSFLHGTTLPTCGGEGDGTEVDKYQLAHAADAIDPGDVHVVPSGTKFITVGSLRVDGVLILDGTLVVLP